MFGNDYCAELKKIIWIPDIETYDFSYDYSVWIQNRDLKPIGHINISYRIIKLKKKMKYKIIIKVLVSIIIYKDVTLGKSCAANVFHQNT